MPRATPALCRTAVPLLGSLLLAATLGAQDRASEQTEAPRDRFSDAVDVALIDLQVVVTDGDGQRVHGLGPGDFRILVDREARPIELFEEIVDPRISAAATSEEAARPAARPPVNYLVFIDDLMNLERNRDFVLERLLGDLELLQPGDQMAIVRLAQHRKLQVVSDWTGDREQIEAGLRRAMQFDAWGIKYIALRRMVDFVANWEGNDTRRSVLAAAGALRLLDRPEGRRALLLVAGSWDPIEANRADRFSPWCVTGWCQGVGVFNVLTDTANLFGYSIYAIDVEGTDPDFNWGREKRLHGILAELARVTGGRRLLNGDRGRMLAAAVEDTSSYYAIAVSPPPGSSDRRLFVDIEMVDESLQARGQTAVVPLSPERNRQLDVLNALWLEAGTGDSPIRLEVSSPQRLGGGRIHVASHLVIPTDALEWRPRADSWWAEVTLEVASVDWRGDSSEVELRHLELRRSAPGIREIVIPWPLDLRRRRHTIVAGLRDHFGGKSFTVVAELAPREAPRPPLLASSE